MPSGYKQRRPHRFPLQGIESLEPRVLLSATTIPIVSGQPAAFVDADGSHVKVKLTGPGSGVLTLTGDAARSSADSLTLTGTTGDSRLVITSNGGRIAGTTINQLVIHEASGQVNALGLLNAVELDLNSSGSLISDGGIDGVKLRDIGNNAQFAVTGGLGALQARNVLPGAQLGVSGTLGKFSAATVGSGAEISADGITSATVTSLVDGATLHAGSHGIGKANFQTVRNSTISSDTTIGPVVVTNKLVGSSIVANVITGSDGHYGTVDDDVANPVAVGTIASVKIQGSASTASTNQIVASGTIGAVTVNGRNTANSLTGPLVWATAASAFIPLNISQAAVAATGFTDSNIWIAVFGQDIQIPKGGQIPAVGTTYYLTASQIQNGDPIRQTTASLQPGPNTPDQAILPSSTLADWNGKLSFPVPAPNRQYTGRIVISAGTPVQAQVTASNGTVAAPSAGNVTDPSNGTFYDFLEFTVSNFNGVPNLDIDTSQVDAFGLPLSLQFFQDSAGTVPYNYMFSGTTTAGSTLITGIPDTTNLVQGESVTGPGIPAGATIQSVINAAGGTPGQATLNVAAITPSTNGQFLAIAGGPVGVQAPRDSVIDGANSSSFLSFLSGKTAAAQPFLESYASQATAPTTIRNGAITNATTTSPIQITSANHGLTTGDVVTVASVLGDVAATGTYTVTVLDPNTFQLDNSNGAVNPTTGNVAYQGGGTWSQGTISGASNAGPIVISTTTTQGLQNGDVVRIANIQGNTAANGLFTISGVTSNSFTLVNSQGNGAYTLGGSFAVYSTPPVRLVSPKDVVEALPSPASTDPLNNYYNSTIDQFFLKYYTGTINDQTGGGLTFSLISGASGAPITYSGHTVPTGDGHFVLRLYATTGSKADKAIPYDIYYPFFETNLPASSVSTPLFYTAGTAAPSWIIQQGQQFEAPSQMVFGCDAVFADNVSRGLTGKPSAILGDLENSVSAALNRGIALSDPSTWGTQSTWFQATDTNHGVYNYWVEYWHQPGLTIGDLAYAFPYDDKFGSSTNLNQNSVGKVAVILGNWGTSETASTTTLTNFPVSANQGGPVTLSANVAGSATPTGTVTFYIDGVPLNSSDDSASPPLQPVTLTAGAATITANLPALADGSITHTYTVTAVYSGDASHLPSVAYQSLQLVGSNGNFPVTATPNTGHAGATVLVGATLPGAAPSGQVQFFFTRGDGSDPTLLATESVTGNSLQTPVTLPTTVLSFAGLTAVGSNVIQNVANVVDLIPGQTIAGANIPVGSTVSGVTPTVLILSQPATLTETVTLTSGGQIFQANITQGSTTVTGVLNATGLTQGAAIQGPNIPSGTTIYQLNLGNVTLQTGQNATAAATSTFTSNGLNQVFLIQAVYTPTTGDALTGQIQFTVN